MWFLAIANTQVENHSEYLMDQPIARTLLQKNALILTKNKLLTYQPLTRFMNRLELLLLELSNRNDQDINRIVKEIQQTIVEKNLIYSALILQEIFKNASDLKNTEALCTS
jgi:pyoverdine/dityrosine biosynthesis protein Dit1